MGKTEILKEPKTIKEETIKEEYYDKLLTIVVVSHNSKNYLKRCLDSIIHFLPKINKELFDVIIIDNNSSDSSKSLIGKYCEEFNFIKSIINEKNMGFAYANNQAIHSSCSRYFFLLNSDTEVFDNTLQDVIDYINNEISDNKVGILGPKIINSDGTVQLSCRKFPSLFSAAVHNILSPINPDNRFSREYKMADADRSRIFEVDWVSGSAMLISACALKTIGLFDEKYFMYVEDVDICYRMWKAGYKVIYFPKISVLHHIGKSGEANPVKAQKMMQKSALRFYIKVYKKSWKIILIPIVVTILWLRVFFTWLKNLKVKK